MAGAVWIDLGDPEDYEAARQLVEDLYAISKLCHQAGCHGLGQHYARRAAKVFRVAGSPRPAWVNHGSDSS